MVSKEIEFDRLARMQKEFQMETKLVKKKNIFLSEYSKPPVKRFSRDQPNLCFQAGLPYRRNFSFHCLDDTFVSDFLY